MPTDTRVKLHNLAIHPTLFNFIGTNILPGLDIDEDYFWREFSKILYKFSAQNKDLLKTRLELQAKIDAWHIANQDSFDFSEYLNFLKKIGYLLEPPPDFVISPENVDPEIKSIAGPQLVVPVSNARYAINAANARWGSLYDALYGTDAIDISGSLKPGKKFNRKRGAEVIKTVWQYLDKAAPLTQGFYSDVKSFNLDAANKLEINLNNGGKTRLKNPEQFVGFIKDKELKSILLENNNLHIEIVIDSEGAIGSTVENSVDDIILESAISVIQDFEDSVSAVDTDDKVNSYHNWLNLILGDISSTFAKGGKKIKRKLSPDRLYTGPQGENLRLPGRSLLLVRNVGLLPTNDAIILQDGSEVFGGIMDAIITSIIGLYDIKNKGRYANSRVGSIYIVKPKMHGPEEVRFTVDLFSAIEKAFDIPPNTVKLGIMDEERRTSANLKACIYEARNRIIFINTGFLDRTGDEIHTSMHAGAMLPKTAIKQAKWLEAYEKQNVDIGLDCGFSKKAQIGKGMWAMPDEMRAMLDSKMEHPLAGANCAWVPSPTAATLHALHYHEVDVVKVQQKLKVRPKTQLADLMTIPLLDHELNKDAIRKEIDNNVQGILGYVVRWIDQGIGCSKVPDINNTGLMEDRATLRISSQHIANWLMHGICSEDEIIETFKRMAKVVDTQNISDPFYQKMSVDYNGLAFKAALSLALKGHMQPNGYTEPLLHEFRKLKKAG